MHLSTDWRVGFVDGEGCFYLRISRSPTSRLGFHVQPEFQITQHERDVQVLEACKAFFQCGNVRPKPRGNGVLDYRVSDLENQRTFLVPFFEKHSLKTRKRQDFETYREAVRLLWQRRQANLPRDYATLLVLIDRGLRSNRRARDKKAAANLEKIRQEVLQQMQSTKGLEDRVQRLAKAIRSTERNSLPSKFWPARKA